MIQSSFWRNKKVLVTGHTGFKGSWLVFWLNHLGAKVSGFSLEPNSQPNLFSILNIEELIDENCYGDIRNYNEISECINRVQPEIIIHLAAQPLVIDSYLDPLGTYETNVIGVVNLLNSAIDLRGLKVILNVTSDKVYLSKGGNKPYVEDDTLGGVDPYSSSKACSELITFSFQKSFFNKAGVSLASARAGNVIGGGDWSTNRLIPDIVRACVENSSLQVRNPTAIRPWQHVLEPLSGYLLLCQNLYSFNEANNSAWNFGPSIDNSVSVSEVIEIFSQLWDGDISWRNTPQIKYQESEFLRISSTKSNTGLGWFSNWDLNKTIMETALWYKSFFKGQNMVDFTKEQLQRFEKNIVWK